jgi:hypothetical protein
MRRCNIAGQRSHMQIVLVLRLGFVRKLQPSLRHAPAVTAFSPLGIGSYVALGQSGARCTAPRVRRSYPSASGDSVLNEPAVKHIAQRLARSPAQVPPILSCCRRCTSPAQRCCSCKPRHAKRPSPQIVLRWAVQVSLPSPPPAPHPHCCAARCVARAQDVVHRPSEGEHQSLRLSALRALRP